MPRQHIGSVNSLSDWCRRRCGCAEHAKDGGVIPVTGFPRDDGMTTRRNMECQLENGATTSISYNTHAFVHGRRLGVIPLKRAFRNGSSSVRCRGSSRSRVIVGSSCTCFVDELGVTVRQSNLALVVHGSSGNGRCTRQS